MGQSFALRPLRWVVASTSVAALAAMSMYAIAQQKPRVLEAAGTKTGVTPAELKTMWDLNPKLGGPEKGLIPGATVERELSNGQVRRVRGSVAVPGASNAVDAATKFLQAHQEILGLSTTLAELKLNSQVESLTGFHVRYDQQIAGLQAFGGGLSVHLDKNLNVVLVNHDLLPVSGSAKTVVRPQNPDAAIAAAVAAVPGAGPATVPMVEPGTLVQNGSVVSAWRVTFDTTVPAAAWEVMVDGLTGRVLRKRNIACYIDGSGLVFLPNPVQTSGVAGLADNNDADSTALNNERKTVVLQGLTGAGNQLTGEFADTSPSTAITRANEGTRVFNYPRSDDRFEEVMSYYHIDTIARYAQSLGFTNVQNRQTKVNVNGITDDNSFYSPSTKQITMGTGGVDDAEDADIIWHEAGHAIHDNQVPGWGATMEGRAMGEGFGDYWAGSYAASLGGPMSPGWDVFVGKWDGVSYNPGTPASLRRLDSNKKYPANIVNQEHADGEIWSATLWQIRTLVGRARADKMILESHFSLSTTAGFVDGANAILAANQALFNGQDQAGIRDIFVQRGILTVPVESFSISGAVTEGGSNLNGATVTLSRTLTSPYTETVTPNLLIPDNNATGVQAPLDMPANATITGVKIGVNISHSWRGDLRISVIHPDGTTVRLKDENPGDDNSNVLASYPDQDTPVQSLNVFNGKQAQGIWKLQVSDHADLDTGKINSFSVTVSFGSGTMTRQVTTTNGSYSFANLSAGTYTVTPSMAGKTFAPANRTVSVGPSAPGQDFAVSASVLESVGVTPSTIVGGNQATGTVTVAPAAPTGGLSVTLSSNSSALIVPATATIPGGATSGNFVVNTSNVASQVTRTITASLSGVTKTVNVTVTPGPVLSSFSLNPTTVVGGN
ncbi:MAG TPA: proprotein convertase P-domain-containing protein, partial [Fimbriimonadaceae bacterium]|nr:proprotein convertase P-domain-containing protein [Fimbriimonadaceae bacterium]